MGLGEDVFAQPEAGAGEVCAGVDCGEGATSLDEGGEGEVGEVSADFSVEFSGEEEEAGR